VRWSGTPRTVCTFFLIHIPLGGRHSDPLPNNRSRCHQCLNHAALFGAAPNTCLCMAVRSLVCHPI
jgi:hypothetical protein